METEMKYDVEMNKGGVVYLAGPMTGIEGYNRELFSEVAQWLENEFWCRVINPGLLPLGLDENAYMPICMEMIRAADAIVLLPGWEQSKGAMLEKHFAEYLGKRVYQITEE